MLLLRGLAAAAAAPFSSRAGGRGIGGSRRGGPRTRRTRPEWPASARCPCAVRDAAPLCPHPLLWRLAQLPKLSSGSGQSRLGLPGPSSSARSRWSLALDPYASAASPATTPVSVAAGESRGGKFRLPIPVPAPGIAGHGTMVLPSRGFDRTDDPVFGREEVLEPVTK
jgi:hypothetical protein